ncbi:hypothetical protein [Segatella copri]|uniref:Uncharacterized protein n=1 Tax=Segatella copri TaxID=165179 RepID=A0AAW9TH46_9BACT|nr:hypothetical protein [Segatella copri]MQN25863.1 hypothetical protein [Segatella copri]MQN32148.1 hypothetical protein [Segatella copri]MQN36421.1 hypothetical protein [Segatella copri]MQN74905.1 hypothetical protein [Segatella copri]MQO26628.1 hypothetical protein [Segatella copri]
MKRTILTAVSLLILFVLPPHLSAGPQSWQQAQKIAERIGCWAKNSVAPMTPGNVFLKMGDKETVVPLKLTNWGDTEVTSISYTFYYTDKQVSEGPFVLNFDQPLKDGETREVKIPIKPGQKLGKEELLFNITQVNGQYNEASAGYAYLTCCTVNKMPHKRVLVEDYAGMWCWHCPIGLVATDAIARMYPDDVVAVSVHKTDDISKVVSRSVYEGLIDRYAVTVPAVWVARDNKAAGFDITDAANYVEGWSQVKGMVYNHVAIESQGMDNGLEDSKMTDFRADEVKTHSTTFEGVNKYSVIRDRSKIEIAAVLFNTKTGKIENAARCSVRNHGTTGIRPNLVLEQKKQEGIYDMQGRKVNGKPTPGIYIVNGKKTVIR